MSHFKNTKNKLEKLRGIFFQIGLIIAGGLTLLAFEWMTPINPYELPDVDSVEGGEIDFPTILPEQEIIKPEVKKTSEQVNKEIIEIVKEIFEPTPEPTLEPTPELKFEPTAWEPVAEPEPTVPETFTIVEKMPEFIGGDRARIQYLQDNIKYPGMDKAAGIEGTVYLKFIVNKKG